MHGINSTSQNHRHHYNRQQSKQSIDENNIENSKEIECSKIQNPDIYDDDDDDDNNEQSPECSLVSPSSQQSQGNNIIKNFKKLTEYNVMKPESQQTKILHHSNNCNENSTGIALPSAVVATTSSITNDENDLLFKNYECSICLNWLNEPVQTACGHRYCKSCLSSWIKTNNTYCPLDNNKISIENIFADNYTRREIEQIRRKCPNSPLGCSVIASPIEVNRHLPTCPYRKEQEQEFEQCPYSRAKCDFIGRSGTTALEEHLKNDLPHHLQLLFNVIQENQFVYPQKEKTAATKSQTNGLNVTNDVNVSNGSNGGLPPPPPQYANVDAEQFIQGLYQRIVVLEQQNREKDIKIDNLAKTLATSVHIESTLTRQIDPRYSNGIIVWQINNFNSLIEQLSSNITNRVYSHESYTEPYGYKFCARLSTQPTKNMLSLHIHLMQSENDYHLDWPFKGRIKMSMIHKNKPELSQHDTIMTKPEILAFHRPCELISTRGFGFADYANIDDIINKGYCDDDRLVIKIQINIV